MRLCWLIPDDWGGGVASVALSCCRQAAAAGHEVTLLMALPPTGHLDEYVDGFEVASLGVEGRPPESPRRLVEWLRKHPQEVLVLNGCSEIEPAIPHVPQRTYCLYGVHDTAPQYWKKAVEHEEALDGIVAVSDAVARQFRSKLSSPEKLYVVHNGTVLPPMPDVSDCRDDLLFLGGSRPIKGGADVLSVWEALAERGFEGRLHWFGRIHDRVSRRIEAAPATSRIEQHGRVPRSEIFERAARSKVLLMLSRDESFGMATVEAMGMGCLPVAWDIETGTREIVEDEETGFFAPLGNVDAAAERVLEACRRHDALHERAMEVARTRFSEDAMWGRYADVLDTLTETSPVERPEAGHTPPPFEPPTRYFQLLPEGLRIRIRSFVGRFPQLERWLRDWKGI
ncbi:glycosyltransferase involved in cell wall biosynthesis [Salinibacter ruber]|uniref:glycosyltransferase family 4 protein n=1 Tax=Salinibacter ruber TaxID=146919 RepID=UPI00216952F1|nr:glycosyltransferase family 4 protein [Salinibacter ruber]MCS4047510.1 glycosyltransferase involved in cell wall biosynthesis [Salinibacter ruber]